MLTYTGESSHVRPLIQISSTILSWIRENLKAMLMRDLCMSRIRWYFSILIGNIERVETMGREENKISECFSSSDLSRLSDVNDPNECNPRA